MVKLVYEILVRAILVGISSLALYYYTKLAYTLRPARQLGDGQFLLSNSFWIYLPGIVLSSLGLAMLVLFHWDEGGRFAIAIGSLIIGMLALYLAYGERYVANSTSIQRIMFPKKSMLWIDIVSVTVTSYSFEFRDRHGKKLVLPFTVCGIDRAAWFATRGIGVATREKYARELEFLALSSAELNKS